MKRVFYVRFKNNKNGILGLFITVLAVATAICFVFDGFAFNDGFSDTSPAIKGVFTQQDVYAVTVVVDNQNWEDVRLVLEACKGYGISPTCFLDISWISSNKAQAKQVCQEHSVGILIKADLSGNSRGDIMSYVAVMNDRFMSLTGKYPKYVRYMGKGEGQLSSVLGAYGQYYISSENVLTDTAVQIRSGGITEIYPSGDETAFAIAKTVATAVTNSLTPVDLSDLLYPQDSEVNVNGYQYQ